MPRPGTLARLALPLAVLSILLTLAAAALGLPAALASPAVGLTAALSLVVVLALVLLGRAGGGPRTVYW